MLSILHPLRLAKDGPKSPTELSLSPSRSLSPLPPRLVTLCSPPAFCGANSHCWAACFIFFFASIALGSEPPRGFYHSLMPQRSRSPRRRQPRVLVRAQGKWGCGGGPGLLRGKEAWLPNLLSASSSSAHSGIGCLAPLVVPLLGPCVLVELIGQVEEPSSFLLWS